MASLRPASAWLICVMRSLSALLLVSLALLPLSAGEEIPGTISYFRDADFSGQSRIIEIDGEHVVAQATLKYHSMPAGVMDGDGGTLLYLKVRSPDEIEDLR